MKIRLSYSILKLWEQSRLDDLTNLVLGKEIEKNTDMIRGDSFDKFVADYVGKEKTLPEDLGGLKLNNPVCQLKIEVPYNELADLVGVYDIYDEPIIYEIKSSKNPSNEWLNDYQLDFYLLLAEMKGLKVEKAILYRHDYLNKTYDKAILYNNKRSIKEVKNRIDSLLPEIHQFISSIKKV
ncbi:MAG: CRISPR-associated protein Cas4 [Endomicrobia bacterium]|nr:CRISPR-associated protein Cas4 [Endomicrobiia bacterium]